MVTSPSVLPCCRHLQSRYWQTREPCVMSSIIRNEANKAWRGRSRRQHCQLLCYMGNAYSWDAVHTAVSGSLWVQHPKLHKHHLLDWNYTGGAHIPRRQNEQRGQKRVELNLFAGETGLQALSKVEDCVSRSFSSQSHWPKDPNETKAYFIARVIKHWEKSLKDSLEEAGHPFGRPLLHAHKRTLIFAFA